MKCRWSRSSEKIKFLPLGIHPHSKLRSKAPTCWFTKILFKKLRFSARHNIIINITAATGHWSDTRPPPAKSSVNTLKRWSLCSLITSSMPSIRAGAGSSHARCQAQSSVRAEWCGHHYVTHPGWMGPWHDTRHKCHMVITSPWVLPGVTLYSPNEPILNWRVVNWLLSLPADVTIVEMFPGLARAPPGPDVMHGPPCLIPAPCRHLIRWDPRQAHSW